MTRVARKIAKERGNEIERERDFVCVCVRERESEVECKECSWRRVYRSV